MLAVYSGAARAWRDDEVQTLSALAATASASVANAELYQRVAEEKERSGAILANIADGIVAVDRDDRIVLWNAMAEQITGVPASGGARTQRPGGAPAGALDERHRGRRRSATSRSGAGGNEVWLALSEAVMLDPAGAVAGRIFAFRDVSRERVVEQMKSDFVSTVSHELRTPLTSIYGFAETLQRSDVDFTDAERETFLRYIATESERLIRIVDDLLSVARLGGRDARTSPSSRRMSAAPSASEAAAAEREDGRHRFSRPGRAGDLAVRADREKLGQVLANLLDNAVRYSPEGGTITVSARGRSQAAEITVADEGIGISEPDQQRVFTKFFRSERAPAGQGTGLGLFLVRGLVTAMGGRIWLESEEGRGLALHVRASPGPAASPGERSGRGGGVVTRVLVIDDEAPIRPALPGQPRGRGNGGQRGGRRAGRAHLARAQQPDVILLDVMMPGLDGWRVAEMLLDDPVTRDIPIVFLTARADVRDRARGIDLGRSRVHHEAVQPRRARLARARRPRRRRARRARAPPQRQGRPAPRALRGRLDSFNSGSFRAEARDGHLDAAVASPRPRVQPVPTARKPRRRTSSR